MLYMYIHLLHIDTLYILHIYIHICIDTDRTDRKTDAYIKIYIYIYIYIYIIYIYIYIYIYSYIDIKISANGLKLGEHTFCLFV